MYILFYLYVHLFNIFFDITNIGFEPQRLMFEKLAATFIASVSVVIFYSASQLKFSKFISLITTFIYAFATSNWTISSQAL